MPHYGELRYFTGYRMIIPIIGIDEANELYGEYKSLLNTLELAKKNLFDALLEVSYGRVCALTKLF